MTEIREANNISKSFFSELGKSCFLGLCTHPGGRILYNTAHANYISGSIPHWPRTPLSAYRRVADADGSLAIAGKQIANYYRNLAVLTVEQDSTLFIAAKDLKIIGGETNVADHAGVRLYTPKVDVYFALVNLLNMESEPLLQDGIAHGIHWRTPFHPDAVKDRVSYEMRRVADSDIAAQLFDVSTLVWNDSSR